MPYGHQATVVKAALASTLCILFALVTTASAQMPAPERLIHKNIAYTDGGGPEQSLDIYAPAQATDAPVVVYVHGGAWMVGDKKLKPAEAAAFTERGIVLVSVNYRLAPGSKYPANLQDVVGAADWLVDNITAYGGDPENMVLVGHSAGAHLVSLAGVGSETVDVPPLATVFKGVFSIDTAAYDLTHAKRDVRERLVNRAIRKTFGFRRTVLMAASPIHQVDRDVRYNPIFLFVTADRPQVVTETQRMAAELADAGQDVRVHIIKGGVSHSGMRDMIFDGASETFEAITGVLATTNN